MGGRRRGRGRTGPADRRAGAPGHRGRGVGRRFVAALTGEALRRKPAVCLRVHPANTPALRCYVAAGFRAVPQEQADEWNRDQPEAFIWLRHEPAA
nr:GNAT family N-acetyltransferase [Micromonospora inyonensis]